MKRTFPILAEDLYLSLSIVLFSFRHPIGGSVAALAFVLVVAAASD